MFLYIRICRFDFKINSDLFAGWVDLAVYVCEMREFIFNIGLNVVELNISRAVSRGLLPCFMLFFFRYFVNGPWFGFFFICFNLLIFFWPLFPWLLMKRIFTFVLTLVLRWKSKTNRKKKWCCHKFFIIIIIIIGRNNNSNNNYWHNTKQRSLTLWRKN